jgi:putative membrane protein
MKLVLNLVVSIASILIADYLLPGVTVSGVVAALVLAVVLAGINLFIRPVLTILTLPLTIITLGLFSVILNTLLIMLAGKLVPGVTISGFFSALLFGFVLSLVHAVFKFLKKD